MALFVGRRARGCTVEERSAACTALKRKGQAVHKLIHAAVKGREEKAFQAVSFSVRISITGAVGTGPTEGLAPVQMQRVPGHNSIQSRSAQVSPHSNPYQLHEASPVAKHWAYSETHWVFTHAVNWLVGTSAHSVSMQANHA